MDYLVYNPNSKYKSLIPAFDAYDACRKMVADQQLELEDGDTLDVEEIISGACYSLAWNSANNNFSLIYVWE